MDCRSCPEQPNACGSSSSPAANRELRMRYFDFFARLIVMRGDASKQLMAQCGQDGHHINNADASHHGQPHPHVSMYTHGLYQYSTSFSKLRIGIVVLQGLKETELFQWPMRRVAN